MDDYKQGEIIQTEKKSKNHKKDIVSLAIEE